MELFPCIIKFGFGLTVSVFDPLAVQPFVSVTVTVNVPALVNEMHSVVAPVFPE